MNSLSSIYQKFISALEPMYGENETGQIAFMVLEDALNISRVDLTLNRERIISSEEESNLNSYLAELLIGTPVQYVLHTAWFDGLKLYVDMNVLIPRRETEELIHLIRAENEKKAIHSVLDICTGSGCIPIALKKYFPNAVFSGIDISVEALKVADKNADELNSDVNFFMHDILSPEFPFAEKFDLIISNPPYVKESGKKSMKSHVLNFEPHLALFVEDADPLIFYRRILEIANQHLNVKGSVYFEINETEGKHLLALANQLGFDAVLIKDMSGNDRFLKATFPE